jgi:hypothetical protein
MKQFLVPLVCASLITSTLSIPPASAAALPKPGVGIEKNLIRVGHRGYRGGHGHRHRGYGAAGIFGAIIAGTLIAAAIREGRADRADLRACDEDFPDFDYRTGTYINRYGEERICPYLK